MLSHGFAALRLLVVPAIFGAGIANAGLNGGSSPQLPFAFAANRGQASEEVRFVGNGSGLDSSYNLLDACRRRTMADKQG